MKFSAFRQSVFAFALIALPAAAQETPTTDRIPFAPPELEFVYEAIVEVADGIDMGAGPLGGRRMVPITGGTFEGPGMSGSVVAGGIDRQLVRADGTRILDAFYEMQMADGAYLTVRNHVTSVPEQKRFSYLEITARADRPIARKWKTEGICAAGTKHICPDNIRKTAELPRPRC